MDAPGANPATEARGMAGGSQGNLVAYAPGFYPIS
jgi:hypothetical protein